MAIYRLAHHDQNIQDLDNVGHADGHLLAEDQAFPEHIYDGDPVVIISAKSVTNQPQPPIQLCAHDNMHLSGASIYLRVGAGPIVHVSLVELMRAIALSANRQMIHHQDGVHLMTLTRRHTKEQYTLSDAAAVQQSAEASLAAQKGFFSRLDGQGELLKAAMDLGIDLASPDSETAEEKHAGESSFESASVSELECSAQNLDMVLQDFETGEVCEHGIDQLSYCYFCAHSSMNEDA